MRGSVSRWTIGLLLLGVVGVGVSSFAYAEEDVFRIGDATVPVEELDTERGGYKAGTDLMFSFGIEKAVYVNGILEASSTLNLLPSGGEMGSIPYAPSFHLIQNGAEQPNSGKDFSAFTLPGQGFNGTIVQNSLDRQTITNVTRISVGLNVLEAYRENNLSLVLNQNLFRSLR